MHGRRGELLNSSLNSSLRSHKMENGNRQHNRHVASHVPTPYAPAPQTADHRAPAMTRILARPMIRALAFLVLISAFGASASAKPDPSLTPIKFLGDTA